MTTPLPVHRQSVELILSSISKTGGSGLRSSFFFGKPGAPHWDKRLGIEIYYGRKELIRAVLYVRQHGPAYLKYLSVDDIWSMVQTFVSDIFGTWPTTPFLRQFEGPFAANVSARQG